MYIGRRRYAEKTPTVLRNFLPGEYAVTLVLKHHEPWWQTVPVEAAKATILEHVLLLPKDLNTTPLLAQPCEQLMPLAETPLLLLRMGPSLTDHLVYDWRADKSWWLLPSEAPWAEARR